MKKIITALGNQVLNNELKKINEFEIVANDLQYKEAIIELLEINKNVNYIILSGILPGNITLTDLITKIKIINNNIEIILLLEKKEKEIEKKLKEQKIKNVLYIDNVKINDIIKILKNKKINNKTKIPQEENIKNEINRKIKINNNIKKQIKTECKVISVLGSNGVGKSIYSVCMSNYLNNKKNKILIIDFDILNNSIHTILGISKYNKKKNNKRIINDCIINVDNNISVLTGENIIKKYKKNINYIVKLLEILKEKYDYIIIDTSAECFFDINKTIINKSDINIFLLEANLLEITKATKLLEIYNKNWNIDERKIKIVINKYNKNAISMNIIKKLFSDYEIIGKLEMSNIYNNIINKNNKIIFKNDYDIKRGDIYDIYRFCSCISYTI